MNTSAVSNSNAPSVRGRRAPFLMVSLLTALFMAACGGGSSSTGGAPAAPPGTVSTSTVPSTVEAARFLTQATMGTTEAEITQLSQSTYGAWLNAQFSKPKQSHRAFVDRRDAERTALGKFTGQYGFFESFWTQAVSGDDQLRQRATFALSEIFVISFLDGNLSRKNSGVASYYDMLGEKAFGNYRDLLEAVTLHPMMGLYLTFRGNRKEDPAKGSVPDQNYAREIMQLFSIGLYQLNLDGSVKTDATGRPLETYTQDDIVGLAKVFTGWSYYAGTSLADRNDDRRFTGSTVVAGRDWMPMQAYDRFHSTSAKSFLGTTIPASSTANTEADLKIALDTIFNHPNVGPYMAKNLIQRLVTSNPSPAYVGRVASVFNNNGSGVRGDMRAVFQAILMDVEARNVTADTTYGKLREPVLRYAHFLRAFKAKSTSGNFSGIDQNTEVPASLGQAPLRSPTVFNFFRVGYTPPNSTIATAKKVAPEMQVVDEISVVGYANFMQDRVLFRSNREIQPDYSAELALADSPTALVNRMKLLLFSGQMSDALRDQIIQGVSGRAIPAVTRNATTGVVTNQAAIDAAKLDRVYIAVFLSMTAPDYLVQK